MEGFHRVVFGTLCWFWLLWTSKTCSLMAKYWYVGICVPVVFFCPDKPLCRNTSKVVWETWGTVECLVSSKHVLSKGGMWRKIWQLDVGLKTLAGYGWWTGFRRRLQPWRWFCWCELQVSLELGDWSVWCGLVQLVRFHLSQAEARGRCSDANWKEVPLYLINRCLQKILYCEIWVEKYSSVPTYMKINNLLNELLHNIIHTCS